MSAKAEGTVRFGTAILAGNGERSDLRGRFGAAGLRDGSGASDVPVYGDMFPFPGAFDWRWSKELRRNRKWTEGELVVGTMRED